MLVLSINGKAIGIWIWNKKNKRVEVEYFFTQSVAVKQKVNQVKEKYERTLATNLQLELFEDSTIADALMDRSSGNAHRFDLKGDSLRKKKK